MVKAFKFTVSCGVKIFQLINFAAEPLDPYEENFAPKDSRGEIELCPIGRKGAYYLAGDC
jgi:hypothetical protein